jgi:hypothetical protein
MGNGPYTRDVGYIGSRLRERAPNSVLRPSDGTLTVLVSIQRAAKDDDLDLTKSALELMVSVCAFA